MSRTLSLLLLAACTADDLKDGALAPPPGQCATPADHTLIVPITWVGGGGGGGGGLSFYSTLGDGTGGAPAVRGGETVSVSLDLGDPIFVTRSDTVQATVTAGMTPPGSPPVAVRATVLAGMGASVALGSATAWVPSGSGAVELGWTADLLSLEYGDRINCVGFTVELPAFTGTRAVEVGGLDLTAAVATPDHGRNPFWQGGLPPIQPQLQAQGTCGVGRHTLAVSLATPGGQVALVTGTTPGSTTVPSGPCAGTVLPIAGASVRTIGRTDGAGWRQWTPTIPTSACGPGRAVLALDLDACAATAAVPLP